MREHLRELTESIARELAAGREEGADVSGAGGPPKNQDAPGEVEARHQSIAERSAELQPNELEHSGKRSAKSSATSSAMSCATSFSLPRGIVYARGEARIADFIDHTLLKAESAAGDIDLLCDEAREHRFAAVCVNPSWVTRCADHLRGSEVQIATVIGFPLGATSMASKRREATIAIDNGATELDMVIAIGHLKSGEWNYVADDIATVVEAANGRLVKVIIESAALLPAEIIKSCLVAREMRAHYVKTSTGFHAAGGASAEAVALMRLVVGDSMGVKASGGVRDCATALRMIASGATRIGTSSGVSMATCRGTGPLPINELFSLSSRFHKASDQLPKSHATAY